MYNYKKIRLTCTGAHCSSICVNELPKYIHPRKVLVLFVYLGKTTLADALVACNGIISTRLAGKVCLSGPFI